MRSSHEIVLVLSIPTLYLAFLDWEFADLVPSWMADPTKHVIWEVPTNVDAPPASATIVEKRSLKEIWIPMFRAELEKRAPEVIADKELEIPDTLKPIEQVFPLFVGGRLVSQGI